MLTILDDGRITLSLPELQTIALTHLISGLDEDRPDDPAAPSALTTITGYTEWISAGTPAISIGWDWEMAGGANQVRLQRIGAARSNLMLHASTEIVCNQEHIERLARMQNPTEILLDQFLDSFHWQETVLNYICARCNSPA